MVLATAAAGRFASGLNGGQEQRHEDADDGNHDEQLDQCESSATSQPRPVSRCRFQHGQPLRKRGGRGDSAPAAGGWRSTANCGWLVVTNGQRAGVSQLILSLSCDSSFCQRPAIVNRAPLLCPQILFTLKSGGHLKRLTTSRATPRLSGKEPGTWHESTLPLSFIPEPRGRSFSWTTPFAFAGSSAPVCCRFCSVPLWHERRTTHRTGPPTTGTCWERAITLPKSRLSPANAGRLEEKWRFPAKDSGEANRRRSCHARRRGRICLFWHRDRSDVLQAHARRHAPLEISKSRAGRRAGRSRSLTWPAGKNARFLVLCRRNPRLGAGHRRHRLLRRHRRLVLCSRSGDRQGALETQRAGQGLSRLRTPSMDSSPRRLWPTARSSSPAARWNKSLPLPPVSGLHRPWLRDGLRRRPDGRDSLEVRRRPQAAAARSADHDRRRLGQAHLLLRAGHEQRLVYPFIRRRLRHDLLRHRRQHGPAPPDRRRPAAGHARVVRGDRAGRQRRPRKMDHADQSGRCVDQRDALLRSTRRVATRIYRSATRPRSIRSPSAGTPDESGRRRLQKRRLLRTAGRRWTYRRPHADLHRPANLSAHARAGPPHARPAELHRRPADGLCNRRPNHLHQRHRRPAARLAGEGG